MNRQEERLIGRGTNDVGCEKELQRDYWRMS